MKDSLVMKVSGESERKSSLTCTRGIDSQRYCSNKEVLQRDCLIDGKFCFPEPGKATIDSFSGGL